MLFVRRTLKNYNFCMFALLEVTRIYKALMLFADLWGPICYKDPQNKGINLNSLLDIIV